MIESNRPDDRRAQHVALLGCLLQFIAFVVVFGITFWANRSYLLAALSRCLLVGVPIWFILYAVLNQMRRVSAEARETEELRRAQEAGTSQALFEMDDEALLLEQNRLKWMIRWLLPAGTVLVSLFLLIGHFVLWGWSFDEAFGAAAFHRTEQPTLMMWFVIGLGFLCFLFARYALAVSRLPQWGLIRAGAVCMAGSALACVLVVIALMATETIPWAEPLAVYLIRVALLLLGLEFAVNLVLDLYRPRLPGEVPRPSFDSRLLGMLGEPGGIAKSIADAVNYQFGFQVSSTWFYQLLQRWLFPITVMAVVVMVALSALVIVEADEQVVIERFGRPVAGSVRVWSPGLHFKWPYPIDIVHRAPVRRINELLIGEATEEEAAHKNEAILWTKKHEYVSEMMLLVASPQLDELSTQQVRKVAAPPADAPRDTESVAVSLLMVSLPVEYRIKDITQYLYTYTDPERLIEDVTNQYLSEFAAGADIDRLLGPDRESFNRELKQLIQDRLDELNVGVEIVFAGIRGAHPPWKANVAKTFQAVISAQTSMAATINAAEGKAQRILTSVAGTAARAAELDQAIRRRDRLTPGSPEAAEADRLVNDLLLGNPDKGIAPISGDAAAAIFAARGKASEQISRAAAKALTFATQLAAFRASPDLYRERKRLEVFTGLDDVRKYLVVGDRSNLIIEYDTAREAGLDTVLNEGVEKERAKANP